MLSGHWLEILNQFSFDLNVWQVKSGGIVSPGASARLPSHSPPWDRLSATCPPGPGTPEHHLASPSMPSQRPLLPPVPGTGRGRVGYVLWSVRVGRGSITIHSETRQRRGSIYPDPGIASVLEWKSPVRHGLGWWTGGKDKCPA